MALRKSVYNIQIQMDINNTSTQALFSIHVFIRRKKNENIRPKQQFQVIHDLNRNYNKNQYKRFASEIVIVFMKKREELSK